MNREHSFTIFYLINKRIDEGLIYEPGTACQKENSFKKQDAINRGAKKTLVNRQLSTIVNAFR